MNQDNIKLIDKYILENPKCKLEKVLKIFEIEEIPIYHLPINLCQYNIQNSKILSKCHWLWKNGKIIGGRKGIQKAIIETFPNTKIFEDDLKKNGQLGSGIITQEGFLIDGNRKMAILQKLFEDTHESKYEYMDVARLEMSIDDKRVSEVERNIQFEGGIKIIMRD